MITQNESIFAEDKTKSLEFKNYLYLDWFYHKKSNKIIKEIQKYHFIIVGAGGIGNYISFSLIFYKIKALILIDKDKVELSNLNRQFLFDYKDRAKYKVEVLKKALINKGINTCIDTVKEYANYENREKICKKIDSKKIFIIVSADSNSILEDRTNICVKYKIPFLNVAYLNDISLITPFYIPCFSSCPFCNNAFKIEEKDKALNKFIKYLNSQFSAPSSFVNNALAASMASIDIFHYLSGAYKNINSLNKRIGLSNKDFVRLKLTNFIDKNCKYCQR